MRASFFDDLLFADSLAFAQAEEAEKAVDQFLGAEAETDEQEDDDGGDDADHDACDGTRAEAAVRGGGDAGDDAGCGRAGGADGGEEACRDAGDGFCVD